jgi:hypothetical protein
MLKSRSIVTRFVLGLAILWFADVAQQAAAQIPDVSGWQLFWHDEFDGSFLNTTNWQALNRQDSFNNEKQYYRPEQVTVANGNLQLTAFRNQQPQCQWWLR